MQWAPRDGHLSRVSSLLRGFPSPSPLTTTTTVSFSGGDLRWPCLPASEMAPRRPARFHGPSAAGLLK